MTDKEAGLLVSLLNDVVAHRTEIAAGGTALYRTWRGRIDRSAFAPSALNFAHYLVMRRIDLRDLQRRRVFEQRF